MSDNFLQKGLVVTSNEIIHAKYHFSLWQKRVFMFFVSQIEKDAEEFGMQKVQIADLVRFFEAEQSKTVADIIEKVPKQLYETSIQVPYRDEEGNERFGEVRLVTKYTKPQDKSQGNAYIELKFNEDLKPHLLDLKKHFSKYELRYIVHLQSAHAIRIYEILKSHQFQRQIDLDVDYLKSILEVDTKYKLYGDFKRKIIDKAQQDLTENCDISFNYEELKAGKKVVTLRFTIFENQPGKKDKNSKNTIVLDPSNGPAKREPTTAERDAARDMVFLEVQATAIGEWGVSPTRLLDLIKEYEPEQILQAFRVTKRKAQTGTLASKAGFFIEAIQKGFTDEQEQLVRKKSEQAQKANDEQTRLSQVWNQLEEKMETIWGEATSTIRSLVESSPDVRANAIKAVQSTKSPILKKEIELYGGQPDEQDFRENPKLREAVIWEIMAQNPAAFHGIAQRHAASVKPMIDALEKLPGTEKLRFEAKRLLNLR